MMVGAEPNQTFTNKTLYTNTYLLISPNDCGIVQTHTISEFESYGQS